MSTDRSIRPDTAARAPRGAIWLIAEREIRTRLRSKAFLFSTGLLLVLALGSILVGGLLAGHDQRTSVAVVGDTASIVKTQDSLKAVPADDAADAKRMVRDGTVDAAVLPGGGEHTSGVTVVGLHSAPTDVAQALSLPPRVQVLAPDGSNPFLRYFIALGFGFVFFFSAMMFGQTIAQSVVEEKQTRVVEILLAAVSARTLLAGKVLGNSIMAFAQIALVALLSLGGMLATGQHLLFADLGASVAWFVVFFAFGFVLVAALYAGTAALVSRQEDVGSATMPVMFLVMAPYILVIVFNNNPLALGIMSYVPFSAPVGMAMRLYAGEALWWEPLLSLAILLAATWGAILLGARLYENSLLRTGARVRFREALRG